MITVQVQRANDLETSIPHQRADSIQTPVSRERVMHFNVKPKYTPGSPGSVDQKTAERVAEEERRCYKEALEGVYGEHLKKVAKSHGLLGIVERVYETAIGWEVHDLLTDDQYMRPFTGEGDLCGLYELTGDFENADSDQRKVRDWRYEVMWKAGARFVITPDNDTMRMLRKVNEVEGMPAHAILNEEQIRQKAGHMVTKARSKNRSSQRVKLSDLPMEFARSLQRVPLLHAQDALDFQEQIECGAEDILCYLVDTLELIDAEQLSDLLRQHYDGVGPFEQPSD